MSKAWPLVKLGEVLSLDLHKVAIDSASSYDMVGVYSFGRGLFNREPIFNGNTSYKYFYKLGKEHVVMSQLFGWEGALAISSQDFEGKYVSPQFPTFLVDENKLDREFLGWYIRQPKFWEDLGSRTRGMGDRRRTLNPDALFQCYVPLPPLAEQQRIVAKIERLAGKIEEAYKLTKQSITEADLLTKLYLTGLASSFSSIGQLKECLIDKPRNGWSANCNNVDDGIAVLTLSAVTGFHYNSSAYKRTSLTVNENAHYWLNNGDLLITRSNTPELVGHAAIYSGIPNPCIYPDLIMKIPIDEKKADTQFVWYWLQSQTVRRYIMENAKGTSPTMKKITQDTVMNIPFPVDIPIEQQQQIAYRLNALQEKMGNLKNLQTQTAAELDAMLPSILDKAFKGEL